MKQTSLPYALMFKDMPEVMERFREFIHNYQAEIIETRGQGEQGRIVYAIMALATESGKNYISSGMITAYLNENFKMEITSQKVGKVIHSLNLETSKRRSQGKQMHYIIWNNASMRKIHRRYFADREEFKDLFKDDPIYQKGEPPGETDEPLDLDI